MKKQMIVIAMMSMIVTLAGCGAATDPGSITKAAAAETVTVDGSSAADKTDAEIPADGKADESSSDEKQETTESKADEKKETASSKSDEKKEPAEIIPEVKQDKPAGKKVAAPEIAEIVGEWEEVTENTVRTLTVNSDASFELKAYGDLITSGTVTVEEKDGEKKYSFITPDRGLWYVPFEVVPGTGGKNTLQTEFNQAYGTIQFTRVPTGDPVKDGTSTDFTDVSGTWYEEEAAVGRIINVNADGTYTVTTNDGGTISGTVIRYEGREGFNEPDTYDFRDGDGLWYSFFFYDKGGNQQLIKCASSYNDPVVSFTRNPSSVSAYGAIENIVGEWTDDAHTELTLVVNRDGTYSRNENGSAFATGNVSIWVEDGVIKYGFYDDNSYYGLWLVPFELRTEGGQQVLETEQNPVYGTCTFRR